MTAQSVDGEKKNGQGIRGISKAAFGISHFALEFSHFTWNFKFHTLYLKFKFHTLHLNAKMPTWKLWVSSSPPWSSSSGMNDTMLLLIYIKSSFNLYFSSFNQYMSSFMLLVSIYNIYEQFQIRWICAKRSRNNESYETTSASSYI